LGYLWFVVCKRPRLVFNDDGGIWEGSWTAAEQQQFRQAAAAAAATAREEL